MWHFRLCSPFRKVPQLLLLWVHFKGLAQTSAFTISMMTPVKLGQATSTWELLHNCCLLLYFLLLLFFLQTYMTTWLPWLLGNLCQRSLCMEEEEEAHILFCMPDTEMKHSWPDTDALYSAWMWRTGVFECVGIDKQRQNPYIHHTDIVSVAHTADKKGYLPICVICATKMVISQFQPQAT